MTHYNLRDKSEILKEFETIQKEVLFDFKHFYDVLLHKEEEEEGTFEDYTIEYLKTKFHDFHFEDLIYEIVKDEDTRLGQIISITDLRIFHHILDSFFFEIKNNSAKEELMEYLITNYSGPSMEEGTIDVDDDSCPTCESDSSDYETFSHALQKFFFGILIINI